MSTDYRYSDIYERGTELFHEPPTGKLEQAIVEAFKRNPARVKAEIEKLGQQIHAGADIRSGWAILRKRLEAAADDLVVQDSGGHERKLIAARRWLHNAGCHHDREADVLDELFGQQGLLHELDTPQLRAEMVEAWRQERPRGEKAEAESEAYQAGAGLDFRRIQWATARARQEAWAMKDETFLAYERERKAGNRLFWRAPIPAAASQARIGTGDTDYPGSRTVA